MTGSYTTQERITGSEATDGEKIFNTHLIISAAGEVIAVYRKIHLFDAPVVKLRESASTQAGKDVVVTATTFGNLGLSTCYDLRFSELYLALRLQGANILLVPSAFTRRTGQPHW